MHTLTAENFHNLGGYQIIKISLVLYTALVIFRDQDN